MPLGDEQWRAVVGFEGLYEVSDLGQVRRAPSAPRCNSTYPGRILAFDWSTGYARVTLWSDRKIHRLLVHRLVAYAFIGGVPRQHVNHKDGDKRNNALDNLEWASPRDNVHHAWRTGLCEARKGEAHPGARLTETDVSRIRMAAAASVAHRALAVTFGVSESQISAIVAGKTWRDVLPDAERQSA